MKKRIAILSLIAIFVAATTMTAQTTSKIEKAKAQTEMKCEKKADAKACCKDQKSADCKKEVKAGECCKGKATADCCKNKKAEAKTCTKGEKASCEKKAEAKKI